MNDLKVIFDTDPGVDDAMALLFLARHKHVSLMGVTTVFGNASIDQVTHNALVLKDRYKFKAPIAKGAARPLEIEPDDPPTFVHGHNGLGDIDLPVTTKTQADPRPADQLIIDLVRDHPGEITLIAVGRMTNLALAAQRAPDIIGLVKQVVVMGGAFGHNGHSGNISPVAEANIYGDPHAADYVFGLDWPLTIVGLDVTKETIMSSEEINELSTLNEEGAFLRAISHGYQDFHKQSDGLDGFYVHDSSAVAFALQPDLYDTTHGVVRVVREGMAIGQTIFQPTDKKFPFPDWQNRPGVDVCIHVDSRAVLDLFQQTIEQGQA